jgi:hypothetical protein
MQGGLLLATYQEPPAREILMRSSGSRLTSGWERAFHAKCVEWVCKRENSLTSFCAFSIFWGLALCSSYILSKFYLLEYCSIIPYPTGSYTVYSSTVILLQILLVLLLSECHTNEPKAKHNICKLMVKKRRRGSSKSSLNLPMFVTMQQTHNKFVNRTDLFKL